MTTISSGLSVYTANTVAPMTTSGATGAVQATTTAKASPTISTTNSATVSLSGAVIATTNTPVKLSAAMAAFNAATTPEAVAALPAYTIKDASTVLTNSPDAREILMAMAVAGKISSIAFTDTTAPKFTYDRAAISGPLDGKDNPSPAVMLLQKITTKYSLAITGISASDAGTIKPPVANATLSFSVSDNVGGVSANLATLQTLAKAKALTAINIATDPISPTKPVLTLSAADLKSAPDALKLLKGNIDLTITGVAAADASKTAGAADVILKAAGSTSLSKVAISDTAANIAKGIASLELVAAGGRLTSISVNGNEGLSLTGAQVKASEKFLNVGFTGAPTKVDLKDVLTADMASMETLIEDNQSLIVNKLSIKDTAGNIQSKLDQLDAAVEAGSATSASGAFMLGNIAVSDKGTITVTNSTFLKDLDALKVVSGAYKLNVTDINVTDALAIKAPSKDATLSLTIKDTASNIAANWDKLQALVKAKTLTTITITDGPSSLLTMTAAQLKANADVLKVVTGDYKLSVTGVAAADVAKTLTTKNIYSVEVKDTVANILKNLPSIKTAVTAAKIQSVIITDATNPALSIADIFTLTTTLPNVTLAAGVKFNVKDTASNIVAHARYDIADVIKNAGSIALSDKTPPNLTLADATTLKGLTGLAAGTKYNVADGGALIAAQAALSGEKVLADAASVVVNKNFTIVEAKAVSAIKSLAKGSAYSINDTAANILTQSALAGETILSKANAVNVVDTSANILAKLDQLQVLAKARKIADIKFTDAPSGPLPLTDAQLLNNAEAIGKIVTQRTLPTIAITSPKEPQPLGSVTFNLELPLGGKSPWIKGLTTDGAKAWGDFTDQNGQSHSFIAKTDGTGFVDLLPQGAIRSWLGGLSADGTKVWGNFANQNGLIHAFVCKTDGTGFVDLTPKDGTRSHINGLTTDGAKAWGDFTDQNGQLHPFITNTDGIVYVDPTPLGVSSLRIAGLTPDGTKAWGSYRDQNNFPRSFTCNVDGTFFRDLAPSGSSNAGIAGISADGSKVWGWFDQNGITNAFITTLDGTGFVNLTPANTSSAGIGGITPDATKAWGLFRNQNNYINLFITKIDGTGFVDLTPPNSSNSTMNISGFTPDGAKAWGTFGDQNGQTHDFVCKIDGTEFTDITSLRANWGAFGGLTPDGLNFFGKFSDPSFAAMHAFICKTDGTGFVDLTPHGGIISQINGFTKDGTKAWGNFISQNSQNHAFVVKSDGTNLIDLTPQNSISSVVWGIIDGSKLFGTYQTSDLKWRGFITPT